MTSRTRTALLIVTIIVAIASVAYLTSSTVIPGSTDSYERTTLTIVDDEASKTPVTVNARAADTRARRFTSLSDTGSPAENEGIWFAHDSSGTYAYVMHDMDFLLDIIFAVESDTVARIHHTEFDPKGTSESDLTRYRGTGKYVLELSYGYTNETGVDAGDRIEVEQKRDARKAGDR